MVVVPAAVARGDVEGGEAEAGVGDSKLATRSLASLWHGCISYLGSLDAEFVLLFDICFAWLSVALFPVSPGTCKGDGLRNFEWPWLERMGCKNNRDCLLCLIC